MADPYRSNGSAAYDVRTRLRGASRRAMSVHVWVSRP